MVLKSVLLLALMISAGKGCEQVQQLPIVLATSQTWSGGAAGSGRGTNYAIYIAMKWSDDYTFDSLWVQDKRFPVVVDKRLSEGDTIVLTVTDMTHSIRNMQDMEKSTEEVLPVPFPVEGTAEGVLGYRFKGKREYFLIASWTKLKPLYYP